MKEILDSILSERGLQPRPHQVRNILDYSSPDKPHVAAIGTAGGKTIMTAAKFELYYRCGLLKKTDKVLILPADKTILRGNFIKQVNEFFYKDKECTIPNGKKSFTYCAVEDKVQLLEAVENDVQVIIGLPQLIKDNTKLLKNIKWLVVDEAHKWYFADTIRNIIRDITPKKGTLHQFLLTGTPFKFNLHKNNYIIDYTSVKTLYSQGFIGDVNMQVLHTSLALSRMDWVSMTDNLRADKRISKKDLDKSFTEVIEELVKKLKLPLKKLSTTHNISKNVMCVFGKLQKTIIFTHGISEANCISEYLKFCGVNCIVSHSKVDGEVAEESFKDFAEDKDIKVLVSVNRGKEGFDFPELYNIIDMTYSQNFEVVMQMVGRLLRPSKDETFKVFYKVAPRNTSGYFTDWMDCMIQLFDDYWYSKFNGRNTLDIRVPNALLNRPKQPKEPIYIEYGKKRIEIASGSSLGKGTKIQVVGTNNKKEPLKDGTYKVPQLPTNDNPKPAPIEITVKKGVIIKTTAPTTRGRMTPKNLQRMGFDNSLSFMEKNDWFRLEDPLSTVATTTLRKVIHNFNGSIHNKNKKDEIFLPFEEAREFIRKFNFKNEAELREYIFSENRDERITTNPERTYPNEWISMGDWLGTGTIANKNKTFLPFNEAREYVRNLKLKSKTFWVEYVKSGKKPNNIPAAVSKIYKDDWIGWGDWLGTGSIATFNLEFIPYEEAKEFIQKLNLNTMEEYKNYFKNNGLPKNFPAYPARVYENKGWVDWGTFLGHNRIHSNNRVYLSYEDAKNIVHQLKFKTAKEYLKYGKEGNLPHNIPNNPHGVYTKQKTWVNWIDWLGSDGTPKTFKGRKKSH